MMRRVRIGAVVLLALSFSSIAHAQITNVADDTIPPIPGAGHDYIHMLSETVNPANGTVSLKITMPTPKGRGISVPFSLTYNSGAALHFAAWAPDQAGFAEQVTPPTGGWGTSLPYLTYSSTSYNFPYGDGLPGSPAETCFFTTGYMFYDALGSHALQLAAMSPPPFINGSNGYCWQMNIASDGQIPGFTPSNSGGDSQVEATFPQPCAQANYTLVAMPTTCNSAQAEVDVFDGAGTLYYFGSSGIMPTNWIGSSDSYAFWPTKMEDRNGNIVNFNATNGLTLTDTAGRTLVTMNNPNPGALVFAPTVITAGGLTYDLTYQTQPAPTFSLVGSQEELPTSVPTGITCGISFLPTATAPDVVKTIKLPNGQSYTFSYDGTYGLLSEIQYPDGGWVKYTWKLSDTYSEDAIFTGLYNNLPVQQGCNMIYKTPVVSTRQVSFNGSTVAQTQSFTYNTKWNTGSSDNYWTTKTTTVQTTDAVRGLTNQTVYTYSPVGQGAIPGFQGQGINAGLIAVEQYVQYYNWGVPVGSGTLRTLIKQWFDQFNMQYQATVLENSEESEVSYQYGFGGAITQKNEYDYGAGSPGALLRQTLNTYQAFPADPRFPLNTPGYPVTLSTLQTFPCKSIVYNGAGTRVAETDAEYDGGTSICGASGSASTASASVPTGTHDETYYGPSLTTPRANATTVIKQCFPSCTNAVTSYDYNETGQIVSKLDACGNATCSDMTGTDHTTLYSYLDNYSSCGGSAPPSGNTNAYLTGITDTFGHIQSFCYGYIDGQLRGVTDPNSKTTTYVYSDSLDRLTATDYPDGGQTTFAYNDTAPTPSVMTTEATGATTLTKATTRDGIGHTTTSQITSDPSGTDTTYTVFDGMGRPYKVYNPTRCSPPTTNCGTETTWGYTTFSVDALGRTTLVTNPDATTAQTLYKGRATEVSDEGNGTRSVQRISQVDGLGRLAALCEVSSTTLTDGTSGTPAACGLDIAGTGFITNYSSYDALGNLLLVSQGGLNPRSFVYDSLSRLTSSTNPESGHNSFAYDANSNLSSKVTPQPNQTSASVTDTTSFQYDSLNRLTGKTYSDGTTPAATFVFDGSTSLNLVGRLANSYVANWNEFQNIHYQYDPLGRVLSRSGVGYTYDLIGDITTLSANCGSVSCTAYQLSYFYNAAAQVTKVTSNINTTTQPPTLLGCSSYNPLGQLTAACMGSSSTLPEVVESDGYDSRGRPASVYAAALTSSGGTVLANLSYTFAPNGDVAALSDAATGNWAFSYDDMNRLLTTTTTYYPLIGSASFTYDYDRYGNRWHQYLGGACTSGPTFCITFDNNNHVNNGSLLYDAAGNVTLDSGHRYFYDAENRLVQVDGTFGSCGTATACYLYDAEGNRVEKNGAGILKYYANDAAGRELVEFTTLSGNWDRAEAYVGGRHLATYVNNVYSYSCHCYVNETFFTINDALGTERARSTVNGGAIDSCVNLPFGDGLNCASISPGVAYSAGPMHFTGKERDTESGLDNFGARYMGSSLGRFMSADPKPVFRKLLADPQDLNLYLYTVNNPLRYSDPDGKDWRDVVSAVNNIVRAVTIKVSFGFVAGGEAKVGPSGCKNCPSVNFYAVKGTTNIETSPATNLRVSISADSEASVHLPGTLSVGKTSPVISQTLLNVDSKDNHVSGAQPPTIEPGSTTVGSESATLNNTNGEVTGAFEVGVGFVVGAEVGIDLDKAFPIAPPPPPPPPPPPQPATCAPNSACP